MHSVACQLGREGGREGGRDRGREEEWGGKDIGKE